MWQRLIRKLVQEPSAGPDRHALAIAVLLLETARADYQHAPAELEAVREALLGLLQLEPAEAERLLEEAREEARRSVSLHGHLHALKARMSADEKRGLVGALWRVAHADGQVDALEEHLIRRLADLLHVPHHEFIRQKLSTGGG
jgi:uncharacterized tellurite resistance protein B-like protein